MISDKYKCIFVHIPKAAGQSVERFFLAQHELSWEERHHLLLKHNPDPQNGPEKLAHLKAKEYIDCGHMGEEKFTRYFKFSFVRNPWARLVSEYTYREYHKKMSFRKFVKNGLPEPGNYSDRYRHVIPQYDFLYGEAGDLLVDFVGRFESLQKDFEAVCSRLGFFNSRLPHVNSSPQSQSWAGRMKRLICSQKNIRRKSYTEYYDDGTRKAVETMYRKDIETFNYRFGD